MWPWRLKKLPKRTGFLLKLSSISILLHMMFFASIAMVQGNKRQQLRFSFNKLPSTQTPVVFLPLYKRVNKNHLVTAALNQSTNNSVRQEKNHVEKNQKMVKKEPAVSKKTDFTSKTIVATTAKPKPGSKTTEKKVAHKKPLQEKKRPQSSIIQEKPISEKIEEQKNKDVTTQAIDKQLQEQEPIFVGRQELALLQMQAILEQEINTVWKPPQGLSKDLSCDVVAFIGKNGKAIKTIVQKSSGVLIYDVAARTALSEVTMPSWAYGKEVCITFKQ